MIASVFMIAAAPILVSASLLGLRSLRRSESAQRKFLRVLCGYAVGSVVGAFAIGIPELVVRGRSDTGVAVGAFAGAAVGIAISATVRTERASRTASSPANATTVPVFQNPTAVWTATGGAVALLLAGLIVPPGLLPGILCTIIIDAIVLVGFALFLFAVVTMFGTRSGGLFGNLLERIIPKLWVSASILIVVFFVVLVACAVGPVLQR